MGGSANKAGEGITGINVTPLVDVMLVLLIIFMVTANYITQQAIKVELPKAATGESPEQMTNLGFVIDSESTLYLDGNEIKIDDISAKIAQVKAEKGEDHIQALIGADKSAPHGAVVELIDALRIEGIYDFALNIQSKN